MSQHTIKVKNKATDKVEEITITGNFKNPDEARAHFLKLPTSHGGTHPGYEAVSASETENVVQPDQH